MPSKTWISGSVIDSTWLQEVNDFVFNGAEEGFAAQVIANEINYPGITSTTASVATPAFQAFIDACKGKIGFIPPGKYFLNAAIKYDPRYPTKVYGAGWSSDGVDEPGTYLIWTTPVTNGFEIVYEYAQWAPGGGADAHVQFDIANGNTPLGNSDNLVEFSGFAVYGPGITSAAGSQSIQLYGAGPEAQATGNGFFCYWANNLILKDIWASGWPNAGAKFMWCFGSKLVGGYYVANRSAGVIVNNTNNLFTIDGSKIIVNGAVSGPFISYNLFVGVEGAGSASYPNLGISIVNNVDVEGAGGAAITGYSFSQARGTLTSIVVSGGVATANFTSPPAFAVGHYVAVTGGTVSAGSVALNTVRPAIVLSKAGNTITFATSAPNGTYTTGLAVGPYVCGLGIKNSYAVEAKVYAEGCTGPAVYIYNDCRGVRVHGSTINDSKVYNDGYMQVVQASKNNIGSGYVVGDVLTLLDGTLYPGGTATTLLVTSVDTGGTILTTTIQNQGRYLAPPYGTSPNFTAAANGGTGSGATFNVTWESWMAHDIVIENNDFAGANGGINSVSEENIVIQNNQYRGSGSNVASLYLGELMATQSPDLKEMGLPILNGIVQGGRGINQFIGPTFPAHWTNYAAGLATLQKIEAAGVNAFDGRRNTAVGNTAGKTVTAGSGNTFVGFGAGNGVMNGRDNTFILDQSNGTIGSGISNCILIGVGSNTYAASNSIVLGNATTTAARMNPSGWTSLSDQRHKTNITPLDLGTEFVKSLTPVSYFMKDVNGDPAGKETFGFLAQEVQAVLPREVGLVEYDVENDIYGMRHNDLFAVLVKTIQELEARITVLEANG